MFAVSARTGEPGAAVDPVLNASLVATADGARGIVKFTYEAAGADGQPTEGAAAAHRVGPNGVEVDVEVACEPAAKLAAPAREEIGGANDPRIACVVPLAVELGGVTCVAWTREGNALVCSGGDDSTSIVSLAVDPAGPFEAASAAGPVFGMGAYAHLRSPSPTRVAAGAAAGDTPPLGTSRRATTPLAFSPRPASSRLHDAKSVQSHATSQSNGAGTTPPLPSGGGAAAIAHLHEWQRRQAELTDAAWRMAQTGGFTLRAVKVQRKVFHRTWVPCAACLCLDLVPPLTAAAAAGPDGTTAASAPDAGARASVSGTFTGIPARLLSDQFDNTTSLPRPPGAPRPTICVQLILSASLDGTVTAAVARRMAVPIADPSLSPSRPRTRAPSLYHPAAPDDTAAAGGGAVPSHSQQQPYMRQGGARAGVQRALRSTFGASDAFSGSTSSAFGRRPTTGLGLTAVLSATYNGAAPIAPGNGGAGAAQFHLPHSVLLGPTAAAARLGGSTVVPNTIFTRRGITAKFQKFAPGDTVLRIMPLGIPPAPSRKRSFVTVTTKGAVAVWSVAEHPPTDSSKR